MSKLHDDFARLPSCDAVEYLELHSQDAENGLSRVERLENIPGKQASVRIYYALHLQNDGSIRAPQAAEGLRLYGEYTDDEKHQPNSHPNIRKLIDLIENDQHIYVVVYKKR